MEDAPNDLAPEFEPVVPKNTFSLTAENVFENLGTETASDELEATVVGCANLPIGAVDGNGVVADNAEVESSLMSRSGVPRLWSMNFTNVISSSHAILKPGKFIFFRATSLS